MFNIQIFKNNSSSDAIVHEMRFDNDGLDNTKLTKNINTFYLGLRGIPRLTYFFNENNIAEKQAILSYLDSNRNTLFSLYADTNSYITMVGDYTSIPSNTWLNYQDDGWINTVLPYTLVAVGDTPTILCRVIESEQGSNKTYSLKYCKLSNSSIQYTSTNIKSLFIIGVDCVLSTPSEGDKLLIEIKGEYRIDSDSFTLSSTGESYAILLEEIV